MDHPNSHPSNYANSTPACAPGYVDQMRCNPTAPPFDGQSHLFGQYPGTLPVPQPGPLGGYLRGGPLGGPFGGPLGGPNPCPNPNQDPLQQLNQLDNPGLYPKITKEFKEFKDFKLWNTLNNKKMYLQKVNECKGVIAEQEELLQNMDPAIPIVNSTLPNRIVWTQPEPLPVDPAAAAAGVVHNHYYGPVINKNEHRECVNCCEDCCEDVCENVCLDCSRLTDLSSIVIGSLLRRENLQKDLKTKYDLVEQNDSEELKK